MEFNLGDLVNIKYGKNQRKVQNPDGKYPILGTGGIMNYADSYLYDKPSILIGRKGTIDKIHFIDEPFWTIDTLFYTEINENLAVPKYLYYKLSTIDFSFYNEGTTIPSLRTETLKRIKIDLPSLSIQSKIAETLNKIDKKIDVNNNIIANLEELAQTLFKRWFVDFKFPDENGNPYKSSGGNMYTDKHNKIIPCGWYPVKIKEIMSIQTGYAFKASEYLEDRTQLPVIRTLNINKNNHVTSMDDIKYVSYDYITKTKFEKYTLKKYDTLLVSVGASIGNIGIILSKNTPSLQNQNMWRFRSNNEHISNFLIHQLILQLRLQISSYTSGSAREFLTKSTFENQTVHLPEKSSKILAEMNKILEGIYKLIDKNTLENNELTKLKETLLPKLMSGELELPEALEV